MKHLLNIEDLSLEEINQICVRAYEFERGVRQANHARANVITMFFENSTRTKLSFEMAINKIGANKFDFSSTTSSINKGEDVFDTINNLSAIGLNAVILRHSDNFLIEDLANKKYFQDISFINAGSGTAAHPTQALLDYYTMVKFLTDLRGKTVVIVGDIAHSRVAASNVALLKKAGVHIRLCAPKNLMPAPTGGVKYYLNLEEALDGADVVMALRIQKERIQGRVHIQDYIKNYQITSENLPKNALLMHPGPINKGVEVSEEVLNTKNASAILNQAKNGVYIRMAVLDTVLSGAGL